MGKKVEKGLNKEKNQSVTSQDDVDSNKALGKVFIVKLTRSYNLLFSFSISRGVQGILSNMLFKLATRFGI